MRVQQIAKPWGIGTVSILVNDTTLTTVLQQISYETGVSISIPNAASTETITADYQDQDAQRVVEDIAGRIGMIAEYDGTVISFVSEEKASRDFIIVRSGYLEPSVVVQALESMFGQIATVRQLDDRIIVTASNRVLQQVSEFAKHFETGADGWILDVRVVRISETMRREIGLDWNLEANMLVNTTGPGAVANADLLISVIGKAVQTGSNATLLQTATLFITEGTTSNINQGQRVPVPRFSTSPEGTTTTTGYDYITAGFELEATARRVPVGVMLNLTPSISNVVGFVRDAPITQQSKVTVNAVVQSGDWVIISGLESHSTSNDLKQIPGLTSPVFGTETDSIDKGNLLVLVQAHRVFTAE